MGQTDRRAAEDVLKSLDAYQSLEAKQQPTWSDPGAVSAARTDLASQPPLVFAGEVDQLRERLAAASRSIS